MFEAAGIDALSGLALIFVTCVLGGISVLVHLFWQLALRTSKFGWRGALASSTVLIFVMGAGLLIFGGVTSYADLGVLLMLATIAVVGGALVGSLVGVGVRLLITKSSERGYY